MAQKPSERRKILLVLFGVVGVFLLLVWRFESRSDGPKGGERAVSRGQVTPWPFTVGSGVLRCRAGSGALTFRPEGSSTEYALNGTARTAGYPEPTTFWAADPQAPTGSGLRVGLGGIIAAGSALC